jgi:thiol:disulfide interchange protein DsbC
MLRFLFCVGLAAFLTGAQAASPDADIKALKAKLTSSFPGISLDTLQASSIPGWYQFEDGVQLVYVSADGKHLFLGDVIDIATRTNTTALWREQSAKRLIDAVGEQNMIVIGPAKAKRTITVFTDVDCPYCSKLHLEVPELNKHGVKVRYLLFPRGGVDSNTYRKSVAVWCAADRAKAVGVAKGGGELDMKTCTNPVESHYKLGKQVGVSGTPAIYVDDGKHIGGYVPAARLLAMLELAPPPQNKNGR